jgi:adenylate cyclase class 2
MPSEIEIKLPLPGEDHGRDLLERAGFQLRSPRVFEANTVYDTPARALRGAGTLLRLRQVDGRGLLTFKGQAQPGRHKNREEVETEVADPAALAAILERIGFEPAFRYEKYRAEYGRPGAPGHATLDHTPIGDYLELEGPPEWIDEAATQLGFTESDYITASYGGLYFDYCRTRGIEPGHMVFAGPQ